MTETLKIYKALKVRNISDVFIAPSQLDCFSLDNKAVFDVLNYFLMVQYANSRLKINILFLVSLKIHGRHTRQEKSTYETQSK